MTKIATVKVWEGHRWAEYDDMLEDEPDTYELPILDLEFGSTHEVSDDDRVMLAQEIQNHQKYAFDVECDEKVTLNVHSNDSFHSPEEWGNPIERGLPYSPDNDWEPFKCEIWGRIMMFVEGNDE
jgi:hypothetical protein